MLLEDIRRGVLVHGITISYAVLRHMPIYIIADAQAGIKLTQYDWYNVSASLSLNISSRVEF